PDETLALEVQKDGLRRFLGAQLDGVNHDFGIGGRLVRIRDASEFLDDAGASLGVQAFAVALFTDFERSSAVHQYKAADRLNQLPDVLAGRLIRSDGSANRDSAVFGDFRSDVADAANVDVAVLLGKAELRRQMLAHQIAVQQGNGTAAHFQK